MPNPAPTRNRPAARNLEEPSQDEIAASRQSRFTAEIGVNAGPPPASLLARLTDFYGQPMAAADLFIFPSQLSNTMVDMYWTYMTKPTLDQYAGDAQRGRALMVAHDYMDMPAGQSYGGHVEEDVADPADARPVTAGANNAKGRRQAPAPTDPVYRLFCDWYIVRGLQVADVPNDQIIRAVETRTWRDMSIGFNCDTMRCDICHMDIMSWDCPHMPGAKYETGPGLLERCIAAVEGGTMLEGSFGYKGATPDAAVVPVKARMIAATGRLSKDEARVITALETRLGQRLIDHRHIDRAYSTIHLLNPGTKETRMPTNNSRGRAATPPRTRAEGDPPADPPSSEGGGADQQVVADIASLTAEQLANEVARLDAEILRVQSQIDATQGLVDAPPAEVDGAPVDNSAQVAAWTTELQNLETEMQDLLADREASQALLDQANGIAADAGGTPAEAPAATGTGAEGTPQQGAATAVVALRQMRASVARYITPMIGRARMLTADEAQPIIDQANALVASVQALIEATGEEPARTVRDTAVHAVLRQAAGGKPLGVAMARQLKLEAEAGRSYRADLIEEAVKEQTRALGASATDPAQYRKMLAGLSVEELKAEKARYAGVASATFTPGRNIIPSSLASKLTPPGRSVDTDANEEVDPTLAGRSKAAQGRSQNGTNSRK